MIYNLEALGREDCTRGQSIVQILLAFLATWDEIWATWIEVPVGPEPEPPSDIRAAHAAVARTRDSADTPTFSLRNAVLIGADLRGADLAEADLTGALLRDADLTGANVANAKLVRATLTDADLSDADLPSADLGGANLPGAWIVTTNFDYADISRTNHRHHPDAPHAVCGGDRPARPNQGDWLWDSPFP